MAKFEAIESTDILDFERQLEQATGGLRGFHVIASNAFTDPTGETRYYALLENPSVGDYRYDISNDISNIESNTGN